MWTAYRRPIRHAAPDADDLPGVRAQPPLLAAGAHGVQAEPALRSAAGAPREQVRLPEPQPGDFPYVPDAPGTIAPELVLRSATGTVEEPFTCQ